MTQANPSDTTSIPETDDSFIFKPHHLTQAMVVGMSAIFCAVFWYAAKAVGWPPELYFGGSLAQPPVHAGAWAAALALLVAATALGTLVLERRWYLAGLMTACLGLAAWSVRGGSMLYVLLRADSSGAGGRVFFQLLGELIVLMFVIGAMWNFLWVRHMRSPAAAAPRADEHSRSSGAAVLAQIGLMAVFLLILTVTAHKKQVLASVFLAGWAATGIAEAYFADRKAARWYWVGPLAVGAIGYLANYFSAGSSAPSLEVGQMAGTFAPLSRILPLDYASVGCAGAILGYWMASEEAGGREKSAES